MSSGQPGAASPQDATAAVQMGEDRKLMTERVLNFTLEIIYLLTGEDYKVVKKSGESVFPSNGSCLSGKRSRTQSPIRESSHSTTQDRNYEQKILELTHQITALLTGEVPVRCQDVTVHFSMEEWEYLEGHKDLYKNILTETEKNLTSLESCKRIPPERCPSPLYFQGSSGKNDNVSQLDQVVRGAKENTHVMDQQYKEEKNHVAIWPSYGTEDNYVIQDLSGQQHVTSQISLVLHSTEPSFVHCSDKGHSLGLSQSVTPSAGHSKGSILPNSENGIYCKKDLSKHKAIYSDEQSYSCSYCGKSFTRKSDLVTHQKIHKVGKQYSCLKRGKSLPPKSSLCETQRIHLGEKIFSCIECGKCFTRKSAFIEHKKIHLGKKLLTCSECLRTFMQKSSLVEHQRIHTGERPFQCLECGKCFTQKSGLLNHQKIHRREKPFSCLDCGRSFKRKDNLKRHHRIHRGEKPFCCSECGRCFIQRSDLYKHQKIHTRERPSSCLTYEKLFYHKIR
ncbi:gastrula zinc finger protein XlCGF26.1-like isoform X2 [Hyla sarda]|uniref:gastrula zinc finger protein XlCGF26.1-like isoform X2 n=1 Tax=Hyla sarda TaxID=327740 RepID=UPI0024C2D27F|nr:gastrula zinc finger protein XlCGF26.1-like isoform X2 [Hyla sarda]